MNKNVLTSLLVLLLGFGVLFGGLIYFGSGSRNLPKGTATARAGQAVEGTQAASAESSSTSAIQQELDAVSAQMVADIRAESRLNLNMLGQLRAYRQMASHLDEVAQKVDRNIAVIEEITKDEFQQNVALQAKLFAGKKPAQVAKHLEEFPANRVGAILANMKEKEASVVLDSWASRKDPRVSAFYREVMTAYLNNRRYQENPGLFEQVDLEKALISEQ